MKGDKIIDFKISVILVLKELRKEKGVSQADVNTDIFEKTGFTHNIGRNEVDGNFKMETLYIYCKYFSISPVEFFKKVNQISQEQIKIFHREKQLRSAKDV